MKSQETLLCCFQLPEEDEATAGHRETGAGWRGTSTFIPAAVSLLSFL